MEATQGLVSVIMPAHNASLFIRESIDSVLSQSYSNIELVIVNDRSTDNTADILKNCAKTDNRVHVLTNTASEGGAYYARNLGLDYCSGQYIAFLDSDDYWHPEKIKSQIKAMKDSGHYASHCNFNRVDEHGLPLNKVQVMELVTYCNQLKSNRIPNLTGIYDRSKLGLFKQKNIGHEDYEMWLDVLSRTHSIGVLDYLASYRVSKDSLSSNKLKAAVWHYNILKNRPGLSYLNRIWFFFNYVFYAVLKRV